MDIPVFEYEGITINTLDGDAHIEPRADKPDTSLSLLVIDLGHSVLMSHESGREFRFEMPSGREFVFDETCDQYLTRDFSFTQLRDAIDSQDKPLPRIERRDTNSRVDGMPVYLIRQDKDVANDGTALSTSVYDALTAINAGKPLPIYEPTEGKWTLLKGSEIPGIAMYRYTR